ncbi:putative phosphoglycerate mutase [Scopulibacillus daqui]|uniref:Phosphoglycerate mutase n=1 Tax=Scopulibacillus daqui TaxID=1469162 RepID=A0ABS2PW26_9BACL|nr:histidine phosphatase family protein [Scopulibacillus daqui]MBM7644168.1 putative phosphoglycerate mutase [Scopulibacillus daqui]
MRLMLIRHLPTEWNEKGLLQGKRNTAIDEKSLINQKAGICHNKKILEKFKPFDCVLASELLRTQQTAKVYGFDFHAEPLLNELDFGEFEGTEKETFVQNHIDWLSHPKKLILGESLADFEHRIFQFIQCYRKYEQVLAFGHGSWIRGLISIVNYGDINQMNRINVDNNELILLEVPSFIVH